MARLHAYYIYCVCENHKLNSNLLFSFSNKMNRTVVRKNTGEMNGYRPDTTEMGKTLNALTKITLEIHREIVPNEKNIIDIISSIKIIIDFLKQKDDSHQVDIEQLTKLHTKLTSELLSSIGTSM